MTDILTKEQLQAYNMKMLNLGAPVKYDWVGYNKPHYASMVKLADYQHLSDKQAAWIARILKHYVRTQLPELKNIIEPTIAFYAARIHDADTSADNRQNIRIKIFDSKDTYVSIIWDFDKSISNALKGKLDSKKYFWTKNKKSIWILNIDKFYLRDSDALTIFKQAGLDVTDLMQIVNP